ncbi:MAG: hypothetical protein ACTSRU_14370 [Candidatus Hodarchaeales archaeon]
MADPIADKLAVIDDLSEVKGTTVLAFDGVSRVSFTRVVFLTGFCLRIKNIWLDGVTSQVITGVDGQTPNFVWINLTAGQMRIRFDDGDNANIPHLITSAGYYDIEILYDYTDVFLSVNGVLVGSENLPSKRMEFDSIGKGYTSGGYTGEIGNYSLCDENNVDVVVYDLASQFGNASVLDSSVNGNNGGINGATWNKVVNGQPVSIVAPDQTALLAQLPVTPVETWEVIDTTVGSTVPPTNDASWLLYDDQYLTVTVQTDQFLFNSGNIQLKLGLYL